MCAEGVSLPEEVMPLRVACVLGQYTMASV